jgi:hypothetical protein
MSGSARRPRDKAELVLEINVGGTVYTTVSWRRWRSRRRRLRDGGDDDGGDERARARAREREREREREGRAWLAQGQSWQSGRLTDGL